MLPVYLDPEIPPSAYAHRMGRAERLKTKLTSAIEIRSPTQQSKRSLLLFFVIAFALTWANWVPRALASRGLISVQLPVGIEILAGYGPAIAAIIATFLFKRGPGLNDLARRLVRWRVGWTWYAIALSLPAFHAFAALGLHLLTGGHLENHATGPAMTIPTDSASWFLKILLLALMFTLGFDGLGEEVGWRGFALPELLERYSALTASIILGLIWAAWHLPYALTAGSAMSGRPFHYHLPGMLAASILFTWIYNNTRGSILLAILFHAAGNLTVNMLPTLVTGIYRTGIWDSVVPWLTVTVILAVAGPTHLSRRLTSLTTAPPVDETSPSRSHELPLDIK